ncbi:MAG: homoserine dehydrogenase [Synergistales bacterium]|nr:homoserine dehydrogenase [Synergistales bacterium]
MRIGLIGFGNVGQGLLRIFRRKQRKLEQRYGFAPRVTFIADPIMGTVHDPEGLDLGEILDRLDGEGHIKSHRQAVKRESLDLIASGDADLIVEATVTNLETGRPGLTHIRAALERGVHVVSTNKGPVAVALPELLETARNNRAAYRFEGVVMSGTPAINLAEDALAGCDIHRIQGIVNGTTNYILTRMEEGMGFDQALKKAQELGYAEADPTGDVEGWDAAVKVAIMSTVLMESPCTVRQVKMEGIEHVTLERVNEARERGNRLKLIAELVRLDGEVSAQVSPRELPVSHPLAAVKDAVNALTFSTDHLGDVTIMGPGAGRVETGQALLTDILAVHRSWGNPGA